MMAELREKFSEAVRAIACAIAQMKVEEEKTRAEEVRVFSELVQTAQPLIELISAPILIGAEYGDWEAGVRETFLPSVGIVLVDRFNQDMPGASSPGKYGGERVVITREGKLLELMRNGEWHHGGGERPDYWVASVREITPAEAVQKYGFGEFLHSLIEAVEEAEKTLREKQEFLEARIELVKTLLQH